MSTAFRHKSFSSYFSLASSEKHASYSYFSRYAPLPPPLSISLQGRGGPPPQFLAVRNHASLLSAFIPQQVDPPLQPSSINFPSLPQLLSLPLQRDLIPLHPLAVCVHPPPLSKLLQGRGKPPLLSSTISAYVPLLSYFLLWQGVPIRHTSSKPDPLPLFSALLPQQVQPPLYISAVNHPPLTQL